MEITYAVIGGVFLALGALLWSKRVREGSPAKRIRRKDDQ
jgi:hypothetical protein